MEINLGKFNLEIKFSIRRKRYLLIWSDLIDDCIGSTVDDWEANEPGHHLIEVSRKEWVKHRIGNE